MRMHLMGLLQKRLSNLRHVTCKESLPYIYNRAVVSATKRKFLQHSHTDFIVSGQRCGQLVTFPCVRSTLNN